MNRPALVVVLSLYTFALVVVLGCGGGGGGGGPTNPGGGGPSFNFTFPASGTSQLFTFTTAGSFTYGCTSHSGMNGTVIVDAGAALDSAVVGVGSAGGSLSYSPSSVTIKPGGYVRWVNQSSMSNHTVTRP